MSTGGGSSGGNLAPVQFDRGEREIAIQIYSGNTDPKEICAALEISLRTYYERIASMEKKTGLAGAVRLAIYIQQHRECLVPGASTPAGFLHKPGCKCGEPTCPTTIMMRHYLPGAPGDPPTKN